jgi:hypothetical protein
MVNDDKRKQNKSIYTKNKYSTYFFGLFSIKIKTYLIRHIFGFSIKLLIITKLTHFLDFC